MSAQLADLLDDLARLVVCVAAARHDGEMLGPRLGHVDGKGATEAAETADDEVTSVFTEADVLRCSSNLFVTTRSVQ